MRRSFNNYTTFSVNNYTTFSIKSRPGGLAYQGERPRDETLIVGHFLQSAPTFFVISAFKPIDVILAQKAPKNSEKNDAEPEIENQNR